MCGAKTTNHRALVLSSHSSEKSSEGDSIRCNANEQMTISRFCEFESKSPMVFSPSLFSSTSSEFDGMSLEMGGTPPSEMSLNESGAQVICVLSEKASEVN